MNASNRIRQVCMAVLSIAALAWGLDGIANSTGSIGGYSSSIRDGRSCGQNGCHGGGHLFKADWIETNIPAAGYVPGQNYLIKLSPSVPNVFKYGFEMSVEDSLGNQIGQFLDSLDAGYEVIEWSMHPSALGHVSHTGKGTAAPSGEHSWQVKWRAPEIASGDAHIFAAVLAANGDGNNTGDSCFVTATRAKGPTDERNMAVEPDVEADAGGEMKVVGRGEKIMEEVPGAGLLEHLGGLWIGKAFTSTGLGSFDWLSLDYRPISPSHIHAIFEGATGQNIIASYFLAKHKGEYQVMCRNGGWFAGIYRASYFVLDSVSETPRKSYYRLSDVIGGLQKNFVELEFEGNCLSYRVFTDKGGNLEAPVLHLDFQACRADAGMAESAAEVFGFPKMVSEINLDGRFEGMQHLKTATFYSESEDPFPESAHGFISRLAIDFERGEEIEGKELLLLLSTSPLIRKYGFDFQAFDKTVSRFVLVGGEESQFECTYLHPGKYYLTAFADLDGNYYPSKGDFVGGSKLVEVKPEMRLESRLAVDRSFP